jgi:sec-independent protein translocase protein TatC
MREPARWHTTGFHFWSKPARCGELLTRVHDSDDIDDLSGAASAAPAQEKPMGFFQHLEELRWTLIKCAITYLVFAAAIGFFLKEFNDLLLWPLTSVKADFPQLTLDLGTTTIMEGFTVVLQLCFLGALAPAAPFCFFFVAQFVAPALTKKELRMVVPTCLCAFALFLMGAAFSFFLLVPSTLRVAAELNQLFGFITRWTPGSYYSLLSWLTIGVGAAFEFPLIIVLLVYLRILQVATLRKYRRHAIVAIFVIAAVVTPTPDPFTQTMFAGPLYVLFELAILAGAWVERRRLAET